MNFNFYYVTESYIDYLRNFDKRIYENKSTLRPYIGIVFEINDIKYYAPLSSPKKKHLNMHNTKDFRKINGGVYGAINLNYMIPVPESELILVVIKNVSDVKYRRLLENQYNSIKSDIENIIKSANDLYNICACDDKELSEHNIMLKRRCLDFKFLETQYKKYNSDEPEKVPGAPEREPDMVDDLPPTQD